MCLKCVGLPFNAQSLGGGTHSSGHYSNVPPPDSKEGFDGHTFDEVSQSCGSNCQVT